MMHSTEIEDFNWNLRHFLDVMSNYRANVNKANPTTLRLLEKTLDKLGNLIENVDEIEDGRNETIIFSIDESKFDVKRSIFCRICKVDFGATRTEYILHSSDSEHNRKLIEYINKIDTNNNKKPENGKDGNGEKTSSKEFDNNVLPEQLDISLGDYKDVHTNDIAIAPKTKSSNTLNQHIPNVFEDGIFDFLDSIENFDNKTEKLNKKSKPFEALSIPKNSSQSGFNGNIHTTEAEQWRQNNNIDKSKSLPRMPAEQISVTESIIQSRACFTGAGIRPCPTYELNNMYLKFPHLNSKKVPNPLEPLNKSRQNYTNNSTGLDKVNKECAPSTSNDTRMKSNVVRTTKEAVSSKSTIAQRGRSSSSNDLTSISKATHLAKQKDVHKPTVRHKSQSRNDNVNGAISKQPSRNNAEENINNSPSSLNVNYPFDTQKLEKFFSNDLSSLINLIVTVNSRPEKIVAQKELIESVQNLLKQKFTTVKGYLIGSHVYKIAKGGLATVDIYLDLHNSFHADKAGSVFIEGMNETRKLMQKSEEWSNIECSEQSRYAILSAEYKSPNSEKKKCHLSFGTGVTVKNTEIINSLFAAQPVVQQVVICVRSALQEGVKGGWATHFSGYVVTLLVIFYFQIEKKLPSIVSLQSDVTPIKCGENFVHFKNPSIQVCKDRVRDLLIGFFNYYQNFDFANRIISPFEGREIHKNFANKDSQSQSMRRFKNLIDSEPKHWINNHMCIQDTFEHKRNVTHKIKESHVNFFKDFCAKSHASIQAIGPSVKY